MTCGQTRQASGPVCRHQTHAERIAQRGSLPTGAVARWSRSTCCCMRPIRAHAWFSQFTHLDWLHGAAKRKMRSGWGPIEARISSVNGIWVGMFATTPSAPMKPMICASGVLPVTLGQICCSVICDCTPVFPQSDRTGRDSQRHGGARRRLPTFVNQARGGGEGLGEGSGRGDGSGLGVLLGSGDRSGSGWSSCPLFGDMLMVTTLDIADWRARWATTVA